MSTLNPTTFTLGHIESGPSCCEPVAHFEINQLSVAYDGKPALDGVSLSIYRGCITALIGPSGCGKSSFLASLNRMTDLFPNCRVSGSVRFEDREILKGTAAQDTDVTALRRRVGMIFQKPNPFPLSIYKNLELPLREHGVKDRALVRQKIESALKDVGLWDEVCDRLNSSALKLSGGQQQRLCIARAIILEPSVLLMDEPCSALDPMASAVVEQLIVRLKGRFTVIIVTHNLAQARRIANYAGFFWMKERIGKLIEFGHCHQVFDKPESQLTASYIRGDRG
jgi:phosphate transport system ATP-binding protein